ncbi:hypothetical protein DCAR_0418099 [Daucus carota subsp. sativus]|uniref:Uncharacterized protein n=1 Tax=Daucus carota subsp. sativus TaxID=79200 RepID=A0A165Z5G9_DAUCS|nr:PREDICTED: uncharacterized protein LOC108215532 [Daucus carota subsp. sativus]WOG98754.1 hypothetical protein DCAR_0418099 [Daucus carota subsp. sativus]
MAGRELELPKSNASTLREQLARKTLENVRRQGHSYVELREDNKRTVFFCVLCLAPCYSDSVLYDHLRGNLHKIRCDAAKATLLKPNPWPFNDGVYFFHDLSDQVEKSKDSNSDRFSFIEIDEIEVNNNLAIVPHDGKKSPGSFRLESPDRSDSEAVYSDGDKDSSGNCNGNETEDLVIAGVLHKDEICDLHVRFIGVAKIAARFCNKEGISKDISRLWCEWLGKNDLENEDIFIPEHDFAVVTFPYDYDLGRKALFPDVQHFLLPGPQQVSGRATKRKRKSLSDPEDISESLGSSQYDSSGEENLSSNNSSMKLTLGKSDGQLMESSVISSKTVRKELRKQQRVAAERMCDICQHKVLPGKDVATLMNMKTGRLVCSSRNVNGAFHVFHISCLVHWILLSELEIHNNQTAGSEVKQRGRKKAGVKRKELAKDGDIKFIGKKIYSVFCPECQGSGIDIHGDELEKPPVSLSEMFKFKIKITDARRAWIKNPEELQNCSLGFSFPSQSEEAVQEEISSLKLLRFYRADE